MLSTEVEPLAKRVPGMCGVRERQGEAAVAGGDLDRVAADLAE